MIKRFFLQRLVCPVWYNYQLIELVKHLKSNWCIFVIIGLKKCRLNFNYEQC